MITPAYCLTMARYNAWQNGCLRRALSGLSPAALTEDRGAFFGSLLATANHLIWADALWLSRLTGTPVPEGGGPRGLTLCPTFATWSAERFRLDGQLLLWAEKVPALALTGSLEWTASTGERHVRPLGQVLMHLFNHQIHHRGQIHAMLTAAGIPTEDTDLLFLPEQGPWL
ncbi:DinB family protein [Pseudooceanicola sp. CBS1P-1]|uniref:Damage-inducible protein DinB n=1 Tax=Pseudooceanicola albus TaxID=2692189 RepID=A0A6L7G091_9RHOB|nr:MULTISPECIES: DinB family protein [Pseudooceanicola]MBT9383657.1 DinB family protein [Pseudooceanicola endophyticus]MXN17511.1 damage-inducible protein DinB [Pseudooceanicola albus]